MKLKAEEAAALPVAEISSFNNNSKVAQNNEGLRNRRSNVEPADSAVSEMERTASLRGITVLRGANVLTRPPEEQVESYL